MANVALARAYQQSFDAHPYTTLAFTNGALNALGDVVAQLTQKFVDKQEEKRRSTHWRYDIPRTLRFFAFGFGMGPVIGRWNLLLEKHFPLRTLGGKTGKVSVRALARRVGADQLLMAPIGLSLFIGSMGIMEGRDAKHIQQRFSDLYKPAILANWQVWPLAQLVNFRFMPLPYRVPFQSTCGVFWTLYLSLLNAKEGEVQDRDDSMRRTLK
ncbi:Protein sym1 [Trametes pubescens]|uniref:Protein sym1 n=1 Tax=Trametes pubescens TaxID=154538 RepID=A0A1M2W3I6_TRAPU|nr:Protein sym1 [Trametes pubescens]